MLKEPSLKKNCRKMISPLHIVRSGRIMRLHCSTFEDTEFQLPTTPSAIAEGKRNIVPPHSYCISDTVTSATSVRSSLL